MRGPAPTAETGLIELVRIVWRRKFLILLLVLICAGATYGLDRSRTRLYEAATQVLLSPQVSQVVSSVNGANTALTTTDVATAAKVISSASNQTAVEALVHRRTVPAAAVTQSGSTDIVQISVIAPDGAFAARVANAYAQAYIDGQRSQAVTSLEAAAAQISDKIASLQGQITTIQGQIVSASPAPTSGTSSATTDRSGNAPAVAGLQSQETTLVAQQTTLQQQVTALQANAKLANGGGQVLSPATSNPVPVSPATTRDVFLAIVIGAVLGVGLTLMRDFLDDRIKSEVDLEGALGTVPALGLIPLVPEWGRRNKQNHAPQLVTGGAPKSMAAEAYRSLRTSIQFLRLDQDIHSLLLTSPVANDGKTTTVSNLALTMAQAGQRVIVLSCDLRKPEAHECFGLKNKAGFTSVILGEVSLQEALQDVSGQANLKILSAGPVPPNPSELLASKRCEQVLHALTAIADMVLIDSPPVLPVTDAAILASKADATVLVVSIGTTTKNEASRASEILARVAARPMGVIVNRVPTGNNDFYYSYAYGDKPDRRRKDTLRARKPELSRPLAEVLPRAEVAIPETIAWGGSGSPEVNGSEEGSVTQKESTGPEHHSESFSSDRDLLPQAHYPRSTGDIGEDD